MRADCDDVFALTACVAGDVKAASLDRGAVVGFGEKVGENALLPGAPVGGGEAVQP